MVGADPFASGSAEGGESYAETMRLRNLEREEQKVKQVAEERRKKEEEEGTGKQVDDDKTPPRGSLADDKTPPAAGEKKKRRRWDDAPSAAAVEENAKGGGDWAEPRPDETPVVKKKRSRWDETPVGATPSVGETPSGKRSRWDQTPVGGLPTPAPTSILATPTVTPANTSLLSQEDVRNRYLSDAELDAILPSEGYVIVDPPPGYAPARSHKLSATPVSQGGFMMQDEAAAKAAVDAAGGYAHDVPTEIEGIGALQFLKAEDQEYFKLVLDGTDDDVKLTVEELKERKIMRLLLKIKNGTPPVRKAALRQITDKARDFGAGPLFDKILPLLMERTLEDQERHLLVKVIDRVLYKLDDLVRPYVHKILVVIEPLLIDEDYYARVEGREIISNLSKAAGLAHMISTMRPDIDHIDEYVRNTTARAFSVVASALGIPSLLPFLKAVCRSKKSWQARHTGIRIVQQIAIMMGCAVLPHLRNLVDAIAHGLEDEQQKVRTMTALGLAALAEAAAPYGIESFDNVLKPLWLGIRQHRGKGLAAFLKAIGFIIPLMDPEYASYYVKECVPILIREFGSADEEMKKIVLKVVKQCAATEGVTPTYVREEILPEFFKAFWVRRMALDRRNYRSLVETTVELAQKAGVSEIVGRVVNDLKDESEPFRKMVMETITKVVSTVGSADIDERLEVLLVDGIIYAFQEQTVEDNVMLDGFGTVVNALGKPSHYYILKICLSVPNPSLALPPFFSRRHPSQALPHSDRLNHPLASQQQERQGPSASCRPDDPSRRRHQAVRRGCSFEQGQSFFVRFWTACPASGSWTDHTILLYLVQLGVVLFEQLGEEYPDTLGR
jgi:splicing factor 3B subunit 1